MIHIKRYILLLLSALVMFGCEIDNFDLPSSSVEGVIIDDETGLPFEAKFGDTGYSVRIYEDNPAYSSPTANYAPFMLDGKFAKKTLPASTYVVDTYNCPHILISDPQSVTVGEGETGSVELRVIPYLRIELWESPDKDNTLVFKITKPEQIEFTANLTNVQMICGVSAAINRTTGSLDAGSLVTAPTPGLTQTILLGQEVEFDMSLMSYLIPGNSYYFRLTARINEDAGTEGYTDNENYSPVIYAEYKDLSND